MRGLFDIYWMTYDNCIKQFPKIITDNFHENVHFPTVSCWIHEKNFRKNEGVPKFNYGFPRNSGYSRGNYVQSLQRRETSKLFPGISPEIVAGPGQKLQPQPRIRMTQKFAPFARAINASLEVSSPTRLTKSRKKTNMKNSLSAKCQTKVSDFLRHFFKQPNFVSYSNPFGFREGTARTSIKKHIFGGKRLSRCELLQENI